MAVVLEEMFALAQRGPPDGMPPTASASGDEDDERRRQIGLLLSQILSPVGQIASVFDIKTVLMVLN